ncbi:MAG: hypothetical protein AAFR96_07265 [Planctomycetota bacterium]
MTGRWFGIARTTLTVTLLAVIVWVVAEGESLATERLELRLDLAGEPADAQGLVVVPRATERWSGRVTLEVEGASASTSRIVEALRSGVSLTPGMPGVPTEPGVHTIDLAEVIRGLPEVAGSGLSLGQVRPERVEVEVERLLTRELDVTVRLPDGIDVSSVVAEPRRVRLTYPSAASADVDRGVEVIAEVAQDQVSGLSVGARSVLRDVPLRLPESLSGSRFASVQPLTVSIIATLEAREDTVTLDAVPVRIQRPAFQADRWVVRVEAEDQLISGVVVAGPSDLIAKIRSNELRIAATVSLTPDDLDARIDQKAVTFGDLPSPLRFEGERPVVRLSITPAEGG